jgi:indole-3-glycerol phosphate synthase
VSILTEPTTFGGSLGDLAEARASCDLPLLRKDFLVDQYQLVEARVNGADAVLLIVAALGRDHLEDMMQTAYELGMDTLVEVHDEEEVATAVEAGAELIGINNRDLHSLEVDLRTTFRLLPDVPAGTVVVAESGIRHREDVRELEDAGVDAILVGETLMRAEDPVEAVRGLLGGSHA